MNSRGMLYWLQSDIKTAILTSTFDGNVNTDRSHCNCCVLFVQLSHRWYMDVFQKNIHSNKTKVCCVFVNILVLYNFARAHTKILYYNMATFDLSIWRFEYEIEIDRFEYAIQNKHTNGNIFYLKKKLSKNTSIWTIVRNELASPRTRPSQ